LRLLKTLRCTLRYEKRAWAAGATMVAGVDEVGRGSLFGAVVAAAVILDPAYRVRGLRDSKLLELSGASCSRSGFASTRCVGPWRRSTRRASIRSNLSGVAVAMRDAVLRLAPAPDHLLVDALRLDCGQMQDAIIHGDALSASIAAASILAKVERDRMMCEWDAVFPRTDWLRTRGTARQASGCVARVWADAVAPAVVRAGVAESGATGGVWVYERG